MATKTDRNGVITTYTYDIFGRLINEDAGGEVQSYTYDANGNTLTMTDATGTTTRTYDALNRNITKTVPVIGISIYEYDLPAQTVREYSERTTDPKGNVTTNTYDKVGRLSKVTVGDKTTTYDYYSNGRRYHITYPDGTKETYEYDKNNQITKLINEAADKTEISSYQYTYDAAGNQLTKTENKGTTTYEYDNLNRLSEVSEPDEKETSYTYDGAGNRMTETVQKGIVSSITVYKYNGQNRLTATLSSNGAEATYLYDGNGNLLSKSNGKLETISAEELTAKDLPDFGLIIKRANENGTGTKELTLYKYDNYNRLTSMKTDGTTATYRYNAQGYRVEKKINGDTTEYLYNGDKVVLETDANNNQKAVQVYGSNLLYRAVAADAEVGAQNYYYLYNAHGDVTALIDVSGNIAATYDYDAFGNILSETGSVNNSIKYAGYQHDKESGLYYLNARYYDSVTARFITQDTYTGQKNDPLSLNLYTYCSNNPIIYTDPSGHKPESEDSKTAKKEQKIYNNKKNDTWQNIKKGSTGTTVKTAETKLEFLGYDVGKVDSKYTISTTSAVMQFQEDNGLKPTGIIDSKTNKAINSNYNVEKKEQEQAKVSDAGYNVTKEQLEQIFEQTGYNSLGGVTNQTVTEINRSLDQLGLKTAGEASYFIAAGLFETRLATTEAGWCSAKVVKGYCKQYEPETEKGKSLGNTVNGDGYLYRGAGFIQLTGRYNYTQFAETIGDPNIINQGASYVAENYFWDTAVFYWQNNNINDVISNGDANNQENVDTFKQVSNEINRGNAYSSRNPLDWEGEDGELGRKDYYEITLDLLK